MRLYASHKEAKQRQDDARMAVDGLHALLRMAGDIPECHQESVKALVSIVYDEMLEAGDGASRLRKLEQEALLDGDAA